VSQVTSNEIPGTTYFTHPLVEESLQCLPAALEHPTPESFRAYLIEHLPQNSLTTRKRAAARIVERFSLQDCINLDLARALKKYGNSQTGREIFYFEYIQAIPLLKEIAIRWLAALPETGGSRQSLLDFIEPRFRGRDVVKVAKHSAQALNVLGKLSRPKPGQFKAIWSEPPLEAFLYILARIFPERSMVQVETFSGENAIRAMLWPMPCIPELLKAAQQAGHVSKISQLDQYHQFTLAGTGIERMRMLLGDAGPVLAGRSDAQPPPSEAMGERPVGRFKADSVAYKVKEEALGEDIGAPGAKPQDQPELFGQLANGTTPEKKGKIFHAR
jgi:hypothetical protein